MNKPRYRGRFAPSPTGPLHIGSLLCAVGSYLDAKHHNGEWLLRIEDLDPPREQPGAREEIINAITGFGLQWDGDIVYQSRRADIYNSALQQLLRSKAAFYCACSRKDIAQLSDDNIYPGTCRNGISADTQPRAIRLSVQQAGTISFADRLAGSVHQQLATEVGDFIIHRADGFTAYQLAVVVDDSAQNITDVVRGRDLLDNTARQIYLQRVLGYSQPRYMHLPVITNQAGEKLSKQTHAQPVDYRKPNRDLCKALWLLGLEPPANLHTTTLDALWQWAFAHYAPARLTQQISLCGDTS